MRFLVIHETRFEVVVEASTVRDAEKQAEEIPYEKWERAVTVREECYPIEEDPRNPRAGG